MKVIPRQDGSKVYEDARRVANARFDYRPSYICIIEKPEDVPEALAMANPPTVPVRIRSGGHHHLAMCSGTGVVMIDLSVFNQVDVAEDGTAWIGAAARLEDVYAKLAQAGRVIPGGGCGDVCVGGLVQGGGWGLYSRELGLTCDSLIGFVMYDAKGTRVEVREGDPDTHDLLWAVRGGGGGNFGVIIKFRFRTARRPSRITEFNLTWTDRSFIEPVIQEWCAKFPSGDTALTTFCRVSAVNTPDPAVVVSGLYLGDLIMAVRAVKNLLPKTFDAAKDDFHYYPRPGPRGLGHPEYQPGPLVAAADSDDPEASLTDVSSTCDGGFYPHMVSSCFPKGTFGPRETGIIAAYLEKRLDPPAPAARRYLSLHCLGGAIAGDDDSDDKSCFAFRDKPFMVQYQGWWPDMTDKSVTKACTDWVRNFQRAMSTFTEGAFINFPDNGLPVDHPNTPQGRKELLRYYYKDNLEKLIAVKKQYDPGSFFDFDMGIPAK